MINWKEKHRLWFVKNYSDTQEADRIDAEYFQPKYDEIINTIKNYSGGWDALGQIGDFTNGSFISEKFYSESGNFFYIRIKELSLDSPLNKEQMVYINDSFTYSNETIVNENDFVFATIGATIGKVNVITKEFASSYPSNNTSKFSLKEIDYPFYYEVLFRSFIVQEQIKKRMKKTAQEKISNLDMEKIIVPSIKTTTKDQIQQKVEESFRLRQQSKHLLECAKKTVEIAIEKNEQLATQWLEKEVKQSN